jgi:hypothetical protein
VIAGPKTFQVHAGVSYPRPRLPVAVALLHAAELGGLREEWKNSPTETLTDLRIDVPRSVLKSPKWPKNSRQFGMELRTIAPQLRAHGIVVTFGKSGSERYIAIRKDEV